MYAEFLGIGYISDGKSWYVAVLFKDRSEAAKIWEERIEPLDDKNIKISFVEDDPQYKFILYSLPQLPIPKTNFGLYRTLDLSKHYLKFKEASNGKAFLRFAFSGSDTEPVILEGSKVITEIKFIKRKDITKNTPEWIALESQKQAKADAKKSETHEYIR